MRVAGHPPLEDLERFVAREGEPADAHIAIHLDHCVRCRDTVATLRALSLAFAHEPASEPHAGLLNRILSSRAAGARPVFLEDTPRVTGKQWMLRSAVAAVVVIAVAMTLLSPASQLSAGARRGELRLQPATPKNGDTVTAFYRPAGELAKERRLVLRARYRTPSGDWYNDGAPVRQIGTLERGTDGTFKHTFVLPDSVVFAALAVEDESATHVDDNDGRAWELLVHVDGKPARDALIQRQSDLMGRSWEEAYATVLRLAELYPEELDTWTLRETFDGWVQGERADSARALYRDTIAHLVERVRADSLASVEDLEIMAYRTFWEDTADHAYWFARLRERDPRNPQVQQLSTSRIARAHRASPRRMLTELEQLWSVAGPARGPGRVMIQRALGAARQAQDLKAIRRWGDRLRGLGRFGRDPTGRIFVRYAALRREGMERLRAELQRMATAPDSQRPLGSTTAKYRLSLEQEQRSVMAVLGQALIDDGQLRAGLDTLRIATAHGWNRALFQSAGDARLSAGDTTGALEMYALVLADPRTERSLSDSLDAMAHATIGRERWETMRTGALTELPKRVLAHASPRALRGRARVVDREGRQYDLAELSSGRIILVVFWSRFCGPALQELPGIDSIARKLEREDVRVVSITDENPSPDLDEFLRSKDIRMPVYYDVRREAVQAFNAFGTPAYYVLDERGRLRFDYANPFDDVLVQVTALKQVAQAPFSRAAPLGSPDVRH